MADLLLTALDNLKTSVSEYEECRLADPFSEATVRALHAYYRKEREFNHQLSLSIRENGEIPELAEDALTFQRFHGFHARGLVTILERYHRKHGS